MVIEHITLREISLPLREPFRISSGITEKRRICLIELSTTDGVVEWSECVAGEEPNYSYETIDTAWLALREWVIPRILGKEIGGPEEVSPVLERDFRGHLMAKAAVEMGVWGLFARSKGVALSRLIGGVREKIEVGISLGIQESKEKLAEKIRLALQEGYKKIKVKIEPGKDIDYIRHIRAIVPPTVHLMVDANNAYDESDFDVLRGLDEFGLLMIEQPLACDDLVRHAKLQRALKTPICLDESITSVERAADMIELGAGRIINIKPGRVGGFAASIAIHDLCAKHAIPVWCGGMLESGVGRAYNIALASLSNFTIPGDISPSTRYWERDIVQPEWAMDKDGRINVPDPLAGIGAVVDAARVEQLTARREVFRS